MSESIKYPNLVLDWQTFRKRKFHLFSILSFPHFVEVELLLLENVTGIRDEKF